VGKPEGNRPLGRSRSRWEGKCGRCIGLTTLPSSCAECIESWEPQPPGTLRPVQAFNANALLLPAHYGIVLKIPLSADSAVCDIFSACALLSAGTSFLDARARGETCSQ
jgi:hypothetical protein